MKRRIRTVLAALLLGAVLVVSAAAEADGFSHEGGRVIDNASLLSDREAVQLGEQLDEISVRQQMDVVLVTALDIGEYSQVSDCAEAYFEAEDFGYGADKDGVLLLISMAERDWYIATHGAGIKAFRDADIQYIGDEMAADLSEGQYAAAFETYATLCDDFITQARNGRPLSWLFIPLSLVIGLVIALISVGVMKAKLKTVRSAAEADCYVKDGSLQVTDSRDLFLYHTVTRTVKPKDNDSSGSSTHTSSSGSTYGGGGGKF